MWLFTSSNGKIFSISRGGGGEGGEDLQENIKYSKHTFLCMLFKYENIFSILC